MKLEITEKHIKQGNWNSIFSHPIALAAKEALEKPRASFFNGILKVSSSVFSPGEIYLNITEYKFPYIIDLPEPKVIKQFDWSYNWL